MDFTGTGNSLNPMHPSVLRLIMDSLRYWVLECHVDGFRFDLASALAREFYDVDRLSAFFDIIHQDPVLSQVKLIAEPWDVGPGGYQVGNFPVLWAEWNGKYRDSVRDFWRGQGNVGEFAQRFTGSSDLYEDDGRDPFASINFVTAHDGFTLRDLVSYNEKHNEANVEENRDGTDDNRSWNLGAEGPTEDPAVLALRARQQRNFLATLLLSQGVPMLLGGDELGRTQGGNNNAWCQDNEISWFDWESADGELLRVRAPGDRAAAGAPGLPAHVLPHRQSRRERTAGRVVVPAGRTADDAARLDERDADARRLPQRPGDPRADGRTASRSTATRSCSSSTRTPSRWTSRCRRGASARAGRSSSRPATRRRSRSAPALSSRCRSTRSSCSGESEPATCEAVPRAPHKPLSPAPSPQGIREDAGPGWPRPAEAGEPGGVRCSMNRTTTR